MTAKEFFDGDSGALGWVFRALLSAIGIALTVIATLSMGTMARMSDSIDGIREEMAAMRTDISSVRGDIATVRERLAGDYLTREEARALLEAVERRLNRRIDREMEPRLPDSRGRP